MKDYHVRMDKASTETQKKLPTVTSKSVMKQETGMSDVDILAGKWKIGVNTAGGIQNVMQTYLWTVLVRERII